MSHGTSLGTEWLACPGSWSLPQKTSDMTLTLPGPLLPAQQPSLPADRDSRRFRDSCLFGEKFLSNKGVPESPSQCLKSGDHGELGGRADSKAFHSPLFKVRLAPYFAG